MISRAISPAPSARCAPAAPGAAGRRAHRQPAHLFRDPLPGRAATISPPRRVDWAVLEVGLGGRLDATSTVRPEVAVITNISLDHTNILGKTLAAIAREKAGIARPGVPLVCGCPPRSVGARVIRAAARARQAPLIEAFAPPRAAARSRKKARRLRLPLPRRPGARVPLPGHAEGPAPDAQRRRGGGAPSTCCRTARLGDRRRRRGAAASATCSSRRASRSWRGRPPADPGRRPQQRRHQGAGGLPARGEHPRLHAAVRGPARTSSTRPWPGGWRRSAAARGPERRPHSERALPPEKLLPFLPRAGMPRREGLFPGAGGCKKIQKNYNCMRFPVSGRRDEDHRARRRKEWTPKNSGKSKSSIKT